MEFIILLVFAIMCSGLLMVMYQKHSELTDLIATNQEKIKFLESAANPGESDSVLRGRVSNTESRVSQVERLVKALNEKMDTVGTNAVAAGDAAVAPAAGGATEEQMTLINHQINFVNNRVTTVIESVTKVDNAVTYLSQKALLTDQGNVCVFSSSTDCPAGMTMTLTFGVIGYNPQKNLPTGYFVGANHSPDWDWMHGGLCCVNVEKMA